MGLTILNSRLLTVRQIVILCSVKHISLLNNIKIHQKKTKMSICKKNDQLRHENQAVFEYGKGRKFIDFFTTEISGLSPGYFNHLNLLFSINDLSVL